MTIFTFFNQKGGVGKTTSAVNAAGALAKKGARVVLVDMDPQQNAVDAIGCHNKHASVFSHLQDSFAFPFPLEATGNSVLCAPGHARSDEGELRDWNARNPFALRDALQALAGRVDFVVIDCPNHRSPVVAQSLYAAHVAVLVAKCQPLTLKGLKEAEQSVNDARAGGNPNLQIRVLLNYYNKRKATNDEVVAQVRAGFPKTTFQSVIPLSGFLEDSLLYAECGGAVVDYAPRNNPARLAFESLACEIEKEFGGPM